MTTVILFLAVWATLFYLYNNTDNDDFDDFGDE